VKEPWVIAFLWVLQQGVFRVIGSIDVFPVQALHLYNPESHGRLLLYLGEIFGLDQK
jgi:hypothetical protein